MTAASTSLHRLCGAYNYAASTSTFGGRQKNFVDSLRGDLFATRHHLPHLPPKKMSAVFRPLATEIAATVRTDPSDKRARSPQECPGS